METQNFTDFTEKFSCNLCNIKCSRTSEWDRHINTRKHQKHLLGNTKEINFTDKKDYKCSCGKIYTTNCGLWKH